MSQHISEKVAERSADSLAGGSGLAWVYAHLNELNAILETLTLLLVLVATVFSLFFHIRRWLNERAKRNKE
jgi:hypothetical protein